MLNNPHETETILNVDGTASEVHIPRSTRFTDLVYIAVDERPTHTPLCKNVFIWISRPESVILCSDNPLNYPLETETKLNVDGE